MDFKKAEPITQQSGNSFSFASLRLNITVKPLTIINPQLKWSLQSSAKESRHEQLVLFFLLRGFNDTLTIFITTIHQRIFNVGASLCDALQVLFLLLAHTPQCKIKCWVQIKM